MSDVLEIKTETGILIRCRNHFPCQVFSIKRQVDQPCPICLIAKQTPEIIPYTTEQDWDSGLTWVVCTLCKSRAYAGKLLTHLQTCSEYTTGVQARKRKITEITKTITFKVAAEIDENGSVIIP